MCRFNENKVNQRGIVLLTDDMSEMWVDWMKKAGLNVLGIHDRVTKDYDCVERIIQFVQSEKGWKIISRALEQNIDIEYELHALSWLLPRHEFEKHPDWFRADNSGNRTPADNMCASNKDALDYIKENAARLAQMLPPTTGNYYMWADDVEDAKCNCNECRKYSGSDQNLIIMNEILKGIKKVNKNAKLAYLAYADALEVPRSVEPESGIFLEFAPIKRRLDRPLNDIDVPVNQKYVKLIEDLTGFFDLKDAHALDYWLDCSLFSEWKKPAVKVPFDPEVLKSDIDFYASKGFNFITTFGAFIDEEYYERYGMPPVVEYGQVLKG